MPPVVSGTFHDTFFPCKCMSRGAGSSDDQASVPRGTIGKALWKKNLKLVVLNGTSSIHSDGPEDELPPGEQRQQAKACHQKLRKAKTNVHREKLLVFFANVTYLGGAK